MDARPQETQDEQHGAAHVAPRSTNERKLSPEQIAQILGGRQERELRIATGFRECRGLSPHQLEDIYEETTCALVRRSFLNEKHLCDGLHLGIKHRALNLHRDERRRAEILADHAVGLYAQEQARSVENDPQQVVLAREDRFTIIEFLAGLTPDEQHVFCLMSEGMGYNRIASTLARPINEVRKVFRSCERKRERFQLLHTAADYVGTEP